MTHRYQIREPPVVAHPYQPFHREELLLGLMHDLPQLVDILARHPDLDRILQGRTVSQRENPGRRLGKALGDELRRRLPHLLQVLVVFGVDDHVGDVLSRLFRLVPEQKARPALTDVRRPAHDTGLVGPLGPSAHLGRGLVFVPVLG